MENALWVISHEYLLKGNPLIYASIAQNSSHPSSNTQKISQKVKGKEAYNCSRDSCLASGADGLILPHRRTVPTVETWPTVSGQRTWLKNLPIPEIKYKIQKEESELVRILNTLCYRERSTWQLRLEQAAELIIKTEMISNRRK